MHTITDQIRPNDAVSLLGLTSVYEKRYPYNSIQEKAKHTIPYKKNAYQTIKYAQFKEKADYAGEFSESVLLIEKKNLPFGKVVFLEKEKMKNRGRKFVPPNFSKTVDRGKVKRDEAIMQAHRGVCHGGHSNCKQFWKLSE